MIAKTLIAAAMLLLAAQPLLAQNKKVYRCEDSAGRVTYSDEACRGGAALKNVDARSDEERKAAADVARRDEQLMQKMARDRRVAEKATGAGRSAALIPHSAAEKAAKEQSTIDKKRVTKKKTRVREKTQA